VAGPTDDTAVLQIVCSCMDLLDYRAAVTSLRVVQHQLTW